MNYQPVAAGNQPNHNAGFQENLAADVDDVLDVKENESEVHVSPSSSDKTKKHDEKAKREAKGKSLVDLSIGVRDLSDEFVELFVNNTNRVNAASTPVTTVGLNSTNNTNSFNAAGPSDNAMLALEDIIYSDDEEDVGAEADFFNLETTPQTRSMTRMVKEQGGPTQINNEDFHTCMFACFISQEEPKRVHQELKDPSWTKAMQEELLQFKMQKEEGIDYEEVFPLVARIEAIWLVLAYASFMGFMVYQMDVKSAFLYGTIEEEVYVCQPLGFEDPDYPDKVYMVVKSLYGLHQAPRAWYETLTNYLLENGLQRGKINQTLFIKKQKVDILLVQVYVDDFIFSSTNKELCKAFEKLMKDKFQMSSTGKLTFFLGLQDPDGEDMDVYICRSMFGLLKYLTSSRADIMFAVCACAYFQATLKVSHLYAVKRIFRYLKGKPHLGLWYPKDSPFNIVAYSYSDYAGASLDRKSTTRVCQLLVNPSIYVSCIKQFWASVLIKRSNDVVKLQSLIDRKKVIIIEDTIREALRLDDADGIDCLPNEGILLN
nr:hypothetical protein [Tanacetum cinerariifolium]